MNPQPRLVLKRRFYAGFEAPIDMSRFLNATKTRCSDAMFVPRRTSKFSRVRAIRLRLGSLYHVTRILARW